MITILNCLKTRFILFGVKIPLDIIKIIHTTHPRKQKAQTICINSALTYNQLFYNTNLSAQKFSNVVNFVSKDNLRSIITKLCTNLSTEIVDKIEWSTHEQGVEAKGRIFWGNLYRHFKYTILLNGSDQATEIAFPRQLILFLNTLCFLKVRLHQKLNSQSQPNQYNDILYVGLVYISLNGVNLWY